MFLPGNILSLIVLQRGSLKQMSTCAYLSLLAVADTGNGNKVWDTVGVRPQVSMRNEGNVNDDEYILKFCSTCSKGNKFKR